uniref:Uncharacterized protein n=1 Tax=Lotharella globosa TaxID=91324 RepID=A0A6V3KXK9_9EUKA|mmetsp:Transcript_14565/g.28705  ORF Transcript_14565/g.28705 Transcript_14565/m.28705 type:complete len:105 (+) Transcript_14565:172-486(+)
MQEIKRESSTETTEMMKDLGKVYRFMGQLTEDESLDEKGQAWLRRSFENQVRHHGQQHPNSLNIRRLLKIEEPNEDEDEDLDEDDDDDSGVALAMDQEPASSSS